MGRPKGRRNVDYAEERSALLDAVLDALLAEPAASLRGIARAAGVTPPTLRHYFSDREGVVSAAFDRAALRHREAIAALAIAPPGDVAESLHASLRAIAAAWPTIAPLHHLAALHGLGHARHGPQVVDRLLEPVLQAIEQRLASHMARGELRVSNVRLAAISFVAPVWLALVHQEGLGGRGSRPLELERFLDDHTRDFLRAFEASQTSPARS